MAWAATVADSDCRPFAKQPWKQLKSGAAEMRAGRMAQPTPEMRSAQLEMHRICGLLLQSRGQLQRGLAAICAAAKEEGYVSAAHTNSLRYSQQHLPVPLSPDCCCTCG